MKLPLREAAAEALGLGLFMVSAALCAAVLESVRFPVREALPDPLARRALMGLAMGATAVGLIVSPWGRRSGAHLNPAVTLAFWRLGRVDGPVVVLYALAQAAGGIAGLALAGALLPDPVAEVGWVATVPGPPGPSIAWMAEAGISFLLLATLLAVSSRQRLAPLAPYAAGALIAVFIALEAPLSGMSMNPARTLASAVWSGRWDGFAIYLTAPAVGMLLAAELHHPGAALRPCALLCGRQHPSCPFCAGDCADRNPSPPALIPEAPAQPAGRSR